MMNFKRRKHTWNHSNLELTRQVGFTHRFIFKIVCFYYIFQSSIFSNLAEKVNELQDLLSKKDQEMKAMEAKYKKYLEKAKSVSYSLHVALSGALIFFVRISYLLVYVFLLRSLKLWIPNKTDLEMHQRYLYTVFFSCGFSYRDVSHRGEVQKSS